MDYRIPELALFDVLVSHYDGGRGRVDTWAARCMSSGGRVGRKDVILEMGVLSSKALTELTRQSTLDSGVGEEDCSLRAAVTRLNVER